MIRVIVSPEPIDVAAILAALGGRGEGAVASFSGHVRADDGVETLELEHYPGVTEGMLTTLAGEATHRWGLLAVTIAHRVGAMTPGEAIVLVATAAPHRGAALESCAFLIDRLKTEAPFWKRETRDGERRWVDARAADDAAAARWREPRPPPA